MGKLYEILGLVQYEAEKISSSPRDWLHYLDTASQLYRYSFSDTLLIHAQRPGATACAELEIWNHKMKRWVNRGAKGIALIDDRYPKKRLRYVFDVSDTHKVQGGKTPYLWQLKEHQKEPLLDHLSEVYGLAGEDTVALTSALWKIARDMTEENLEEAMEGLEYEVEGTFLEDLDEQTIQTEFRELLQNSIFYSLSRRCGLDPMDVLEEGDFIAITDFHSMSVLPFLGNATNQIVEPILRDIGRTVWRMDWEEQKEKSQKRVENSSRTHYNEFNTLMQESEENGGNENGTDILPQRGLPVSELDNRKRTSEHREVRNASEDIPEGKPEELVSEHAADRKIGEISDGNRESSTGENGSSDEWTSYSISGSGQGGRSDEVGGTHEQSPADGRGERFDGIGIQLSEEQTEQDFDGAEEEIASALSLPLLPPVEKQIREIEERQVALYAKEVTIPAKIVDEVLRYGGNRTGSYLRIIYNFMIEQPEEAYTEFVQKEYGKGGIGLQISGREYAVWYDELGIERVDTASEALALSLAERAKIDLSFMTELTGKPEAEIIEELTGVIFQNPLTEKWETSDEYLSGNVRVKLEVAKQFAENHDRYQVNVQALEKVQPKELEASEIEIRLGATWVDAEYITEFMGELFQTPDYYLGSRIEVKYAPVNGQWNISGKSLDTYGNTRVTATYGTARANAYRLLEDALNLRDTKIYDTIQDADGEHRVLNKKETMLAQQKQDMIKEAFKEWIFRDIDRREALCKKYNEIFNSVRPREYDGSHIQFVGMTPEITLMPHQKNAVAHVLYGGNTLLAHCVGAGKTFQMIAAGMESKRLGLSQKNLYVVPNHLTEQWGSDFLRLYPGANVLVATKKDFEPANRKKFCSRIATGDYDAIIIGHSQFERIPLSKERQMAMIEQQIEEIMLAIEEAQSDDSPRYTIKQMEKTRKGLEKRLEKLNDDTRKDDVVTFEQLGVDRLFVDESHFYKNLFLYTKMRNIAGIAQTDAQKSSDMFMKCRYMDELTGGKGVTFATGTPVSNSMTELYTIMRYLQYDTLQKLQLGHFDSWAATFGETVTAVELSPEGTGYRAKTRFARFFNLPELISLFKESADIQTADMLHLPVPEAEYINEVLKPSEEQQELVAAFGERAEMVRSGGVDASVDNMLKITNDGRKCALDQRLINDMLPDYEDSKINRCVENTFSIWEETKEHLSTQLIFCDLSTPKSDGSFNVYDDIREKLVTKGIPKEEIVFIHEAGTETKKAELFAKVRSGQVRVLLGSTPKLGAGTNIQDRLIALHHLDCPWKPADLEQQEGRILRQGNQNKKVKIFRYVTENTFDAYMWQILENKQKFISQIMTSKSPVRACEDVDDTALSYAEIKALATGNPYIKEKMDLDIQVSKLKLLKANHTSQKYKLETDIAKNYPMQIATQKERLAGLRSDAEAVRPIFENEDFSMIVSNKTFTDKKEAGTALLAACEGLKAIHTEGKIGTFHDFSLYAKFDAFNQRYIMTIKRKCSYLIEMGKDILGNLQRISNALGGIEKKMEETEQKLETLQKQLETAQEEAAKPFPKEKELQEKMERLAELNSLLNMDEKEMPQDQEKEVDQVADLPRRSVNYAGRVSEGRKGKIEKSSVLGRLKTTQRNMEKGWKNRNMQKKKPEQQL